MLGFVFRGWKNLHRIQFERFYEFWKILAFAPEGATLRVLYGRLWTKNHCPRKIKLRITKFQPFQLFPGQMGPKPKRKSVEGLSTNYKNTGKNLRANAKKCLRVSWSKISFNQLDLKNMAQLVYTTLSPNRFECT